MLGQSGMPGNEYADGMIEHDGDVGELLKAIDDMGIADNTIVVYTTDNGPNQFSWPDAATTPFRSEKDTNWEGAFRVPAMVRWPGHIKPGQVTTEMFSGMDWFPTLLAAAGDPDVKDELLAGKQIGDKTFKVHLDGYNQLPLPDRRDRQERPQRVPLLRRRRPARRLPLRQLEGGLLRAARAGGFKVWYENFDCYRIPKIFNLRMDPYERADIVSDQYDDWRVEERLLPRLHGLEGRRVPRRPSSTGRRARSRRPSPSTRSRPRSTPRPRQDGGREGHPGRAGEPLMRPLRHALLALAVASAASAAAAGPFAPDEIADRALERRAVEAVIWGMPAVNYDLMLPGDARRHRRRARAGDLLGPAARLDEPDADPEPRHRSTS